MKWKNKLGKAICCSCHKPHAKNIHINIYRTIVCNITRIKMSQVSINKWLVKYNRFLRWIFHSNQKMNEAALSIYWYLQAKWKSKVQEFAYSMPTGGRTHKKLATVIASREGTYMSGRLRGKRRAFLFIAHLFKILWRCMFYLYKNKYFKHFRLYKVKTT